MKQWAWAVPDWNAIKVLADSGPWLELGAGSGYWASLIVQAGGDVIATDREPWRHRGRTEYYPVYCLDAKEAVEVMPCHDLLLVWPTCADPWAVEAIRESRAKRVAFVGERYGCTGDDALSEELFDSARWAVECEHEIPQWWGLHDYLWIFRRESSR